MWDVIWWLGCSEFGVLEGETYACEMNDKMFLWDDDGDLIYVPFLLSVFEFN